MTNPLFVIYSFFKDFDNRIAGIGSAFIPK